MFPFKRFCAVRLWCCWRKAQSDRVTADTELLGFWSVHLTGRSLIPERCSSVCTPESSCAHTAGVWRWLNPDSSSPTIGGEICWHPWSVSMFGRDYLVLWGLYRSGLKPPELITGSCRAAIQKICLRCFFCKYAHRVRSELSEVTCSIIIIFRRVFTPMFWSNVPTLFFFFIHFHAHFLDEIQCLCEKTGWLHQSSLRHNNQRRISRSSWRSCWAAVNVDSRHIAVDRNV